MICRTHCPGHGAPVALAVSVAAAAAVAAGVVWVLESVIVALLIMMAVVVAGSVTALAYVLRREFSFPTWKPARAVPVRQELPAAERLAIEAPKPALTSVLQVRAEARR